MFETVRGRIAAVVALSPVGAVSGVVPFIAVAELARVLWPAIDGGPVDEGRAWGTVLLAIGALVISFLATGGAGLVSHLADNDMQLDLRTRIVRHLRSLPLGWFDACSSGAVKKAVENDVSALHHLVAHAIGDFTAALGSTPRSGSSSRTRTCCAPASATTSGSPGPTPTTPPSSGSPVPRRSTSGSCGCRGATTPSSGLIALLVLGIRFTEPITHSGALGGGSSMATNTLDRIQELLDEPALPEPVAASTATSASAAEPGAASAPCDWSVRLTDVTVGYGTGHGSEPGCRDSLRLPAPAPAAPARGGGGGCGSAVVRVVALDVLG